MRMRKIISYLLVFAMVFGFATNLGVMDAKADEKEYTLYFKLPEDTTASDWCLNIWGGAVVTAANTDGAFRPSTWGDSDKFPALLQADDTAWAYAKIQGTVEGMQFVDKGGKEYKCWNAEIINGGYTSAYFNSADSKWYKECECTNEIVAPTLDEVFYLAGAEGLASVNWLATGDKLVEAEEGVYVYTKQNVQPGTYEFKILQDSEDFGWEYAWGINAQTNCVAPGGENAIITIDKVSNVAVVFKYFEGQGEIQVDITEPTEETEPTTEPTVEPTEQPAETDTIVLNIKNDVEWDAIYAHVWNVDNSVDTTKNLTGEWPGAIATVNSANSGWYTVTISINADNKGMTKMGLVANNGNGKPQSQDFEYRNITEGKNELWIVLGPNSEEGANCLIGGVDKPEGWVDTVAPTPAPTQAPASATPTPAPTTTPEPVQVEEPTAKFHFKNSENWEKVGIYFTTGEGWTEVTGKWPGSAMTLETGSTTWFEYDYYGIEKSFNYIFNNMVEGEGALQTVNIEKAVPGEYWITLGEKDAEGKFKVNIATAAPADYDGKGIPGKVAANWSDIKAKIDEAVKNATDDKAATVDIDMKDSTKVPADILAAVKGKNVDVQFKMANNLVWIVNGKNIKDATKELNIGATLNANTIDAKKVEKLASTIKCKKAIQLSLAHNGDFGAKLNLKSLLGKEYAGKFAVLYYYNPTGDKFEYQQYVKVDAEGYVVLGFDHASDYVIAITDNVVAKTTAAKTADPVSAAGYTFMMLIASAAIVLVYKKRSVFEQ